MVFSLFRGLLEKNGQGQHAVAPRRSARKERISILWLQMALDTENLILIVRGGFQCPAVDRSWLGPRAKSCLSVGGKAGHGSVGWSGRKRLMWPEVLHVDRWIILAGDSSVVG